MEERLPLPGGAGIRGQHGPNLGRHVMSHDGDHYYGNDFDDNMSDISGGLPRHPMRDFFDRQGVGHGGHRGGVLNARTMVLVKSK